METREFIEFCTREEARLKWYVEARGVAEGLLTLQKDRDAATLALAKAIKDREAVLVDIEARKAKDAKAAEKERGELAAMLARDQAMADGELAKAKTELGKVQAMTSAARAALVDAEARRDAFRTLAEQEMAALTRSRDALQREEQAIRERLSAALKQ